VSRVRGGVAVVALCLLVACGGNSADDGQRIDVGMQDFTLHPSATTASPGKITLHLLNRGPSTHEINVDRTDLAEDKLPLRLDGLSVEEDSPELSRIDSIEIVEAGDRATLHLDLPPGHYVLYCNLEGHYLGHMYSTLDVG
jgi:uncharacterized cupredoxin-like copper-binding protein